MYWKLVYKDKEKRYRAFDAEINNNNNNDFFFESEEKEKVSGEITALFKKTVSKIFKRE